jgi:hypothetical protein
MPCDLVSGEPAKACVALECFYVDIAQEPRRLGATYQRLEALSATWWLAMLA